MLTVQSLQCLTKDVKCLNLQFGVFWLQATQYASQNLTKMLATKFSCCNKIHVRDAILFKAWQFFFLTLGLRLAGHL